MLISDMIRHCARSYGTKTAYIDGDRSRTWAEMDARSDELAAALHRHGVNAGDACAILSQDRLEVLEHWFACVKLGAIRVGINYRYSPHEVAHVIDDCGATCVLVEAQSAHLLSEAMPVLRERKALVVGFGAGNDLGHDLDHDLDELLAEPSSGYPAAEPGDDDPVAFAYTAGSTGLPKGVVWTSGGMREGMKWLAINVGLRREDRWLSALPAAAGPLIFVSMNVVNGMTTILPGGRFEPARFLQLIEDLQVTATMLVPTMLQDVLVQQRRDPRDIQSMRLLCYGSMPATPAVIRDARQVFGCEIQQWYGSTEMTGISAILRDEDHVDALDGRPGILASCGRPLMHFDVEIRHDDGTTCAPGEIGEIWVRGQTLFRGYLNRAQETADAFVDGWFRPGDVGRLDQDGYLYILDRKNFMIISGGYNVYPTVVESVLAEHAAVREVVVVGAPHPRWGEAVAVVVTLHDGAALVTDDLVQLARERLAKWEIPRHVEIMDSLPLGATGKVDRRKIRDMFRADPGRLGW